MSVMSKVRDWIATCPYLEDFRELFLDYLGDRECYSIESTPIEPIVKRYLDGGTVRQKAFSFCSVEVMDGADNIDTSDFYENFVSWVEEANKNGDLPDLGSGKSCLSIKATTDGYAYDFTGIRAQYRIQLNLKYFQEG